MNLKGVVRKHRSSYKTNGAADPGLVGRTTKPGCSRLFKRQRILLSFAVGSARGQRHVSLADRFGQ